jgi:hypothetical protein
VDGDKVLNYTELNEMHKRTLYGGECPAPHANPKANSTILENADLSNLEDWIGGGRSIQLTKIYSSEDEGGKCYPDRWRQATKNTPNVLLVARTQYGKKLAMYTPSGYKDFNTKVMIYDSQVQIISFSQG